MEKKTKGMLESQEPISLLFIPRTVNGRLATRLRRKEEELQKTLGMKVKMVERGGDMLRSMLVRNNPWSYQDCERQECIPCEKTEGMKDSCCSSRNIVYASECMECKANGKVSRYIGESSRSLFERAGEHMKDSKRKEEEGAQSEDCKKKTSHMKDHWIQEHEGRETEFRFRILKKCQSSFQREIQEAVLIKLWGEKKEVNLLNAKEEFN